ncbi:immunoglobulin-like domain-containing protein [Pistricoccus aurantiacus]|uniref:immunoglobulin-like domain-containing protein n=1 Tax=Pistricoccus aurantiacus TaxID=1883414 RepID=UPI00362E1620
MNNGETIIIAAGQSSGEITVDAPADDVYVDAGEVTTRITGAEEIDGGGNAIAAGTPGSLEALQVDDTPVATQVNDSIDTVRVELEAPAQANEGDTLIVTLRVAEPPQNGPITIELSDGTSAEIAEGATSAQVVLNVPNPNQAQGPGEANRTITDWTVSIDSVSGGNYENLVPGDAATVRVNEDVPGLRVPDANGGEVGDVSVYEAGLANGSDPGDTRSVDGSFTIASGGVDNLSTVSIGGSDFTPAQLAGASVGAPLTIDSPRYGSLAITGYDASTGQVDYIYTLTDRADQSGGAVIDPIPIRVTDASGDSREDNLRVNIVDDSPSPTDDPARSVTEGGAAITGNLLDNDTQGADGSARVSRIDYTDRSGNPARASIAEGADVSVATRHGELTVDSDGSWSYTPLDSADHSASGDDIQAQDTFDYVLTDGDGSVSSPATQPIQVVDTAPEVGSADNVRVEERYLDSGTQAGGGQLTQSGSLAVEPAQDSFDTTFDAGNLSALEALGLTARDNALDYAISPDGHTLTATAAGEAIFTVVITNPTGDNAGYEFTLEGPLDHVAEVTNSDGDIDLPFAYDVEDSDGDVVGGNFTVSVVNNASPTTQSIAVEEDDSYELVTPANAIRNNITFDTDPQYGAVSVAPDGTLTYTPNPDYSGADGFTYRYTEGGETRTVQVDVTVDPVADPPTLSGSDVDTLEDTSVDLNLTAPTPNDVTDQNGPGANGDNPQLLGPITLIGLPAGARLLDGNGDTLRTGNGSDISIVLSDGEHIAGASGDLILTTAQYQALGIAPPAQSHRNFTLELSVTSFEVDDSGNPLSGVAGATSNAQVPVRVRAVTDDVTLTIDGSDDPYVAVIDEDGALDLGSLLGASFQDLDGSERRWIEITGLPEGSVVDGEAVSGGSITVPAPGLSTSTAGFPPLMVTPPENFSGEIGPVTVTLKAQDRDPDAGDSNGAVKQDSVTLTIQAAPVADRPADISATGPEDSEIAFLADLIPSDRDGSESITAIAIDSVPTGWLIQDAAGNAVHTGDGSGGFRIPPADVADGDYRNYSITPPAHSSQDARLSLQVEVTDTGPGGPNVVTHDVTAEVAVTPVAERIAASGDPLVDSDGDGLADLTMTGGHTYGSGVDGIEDAWFALNADGFNPANGWTNQDADGSERTFALLTPELVQSEDGGSAIGASFRYQDAGGGWTTLAFNGNPVEVPVEYLDTLEFRAPRHQKGEFRINLQARTVDTDGDGNTDSAVSGGAVLDDIFIDQPVADKASLSVTSPALGNEDEPIALGIRPQSEDPNESFRVTLAGVPAGAVLTYDGVEVIDDGNGNYTIDDFDRSKPLTVTPPADSNADFSLTASVVTVDTYGGITDSLATPVSKTLAVRVRGVADEPNVSINTPVYREADLDDGAASVALGDIITAESGETTADGSETLSYRITGLDAQFDVENATLIRGDGATREWVTRNPGTTTIATPENFSGQVDFSATPVVTESDGDSRDGAPQPLSFRVTPSPEATFTPDSNLEEDTLGRLELDLAPQNGDTDESLNAVGIRIDSIGGNLTLYYGSDGGTTLARAAADGGIPEVTEEGGYYRLTAGAWENIYAQGSANFAGNAGTLAIEYEVTDIPDPQYASDIGAVTETRNDSHQVNIAAVTDTPTLAITQITNASGSDATINGKDVSAGVDDRMVVTVQVDQVADTNGQPDEDGSEALRYLLIDNVPAGVSVADGNFVGRVGGGTGSQWRIDIEPDGVFSGAPLTRTVEFVMGDTRQVGDIVDQNITITAVTQDNGRNSELKSAGDSWTLSGEGPFGPGSGPNKILAWEDANAVMNEDEATTLADLVVAEVEDNGGSTAGRSAVTLANLPEGTRVDGMQETVINGEVVWYASTSDGSNQGLQNLLAGIRVTPPADSNDTDQAFSFETTLTTQSPSGEEEVATISITPPVTPVTDTPLVEVAGNDVESGEEVTFTIGVSSPADAPDVSLVNGRLALQLDESAMLAGDGASVGGSLWVNGTEITPEADGSYIIDEVALGDKLNAVYRPADNTWGDVSLTAQATTRENGAANSATSSGSNTSEIAPPSPTLSASDASGNEDEAVVLNGLAVDLPDPSRQNLDTLLLEDVPENWLVRTGSDAGSATLAGNVGGGSWSILEDDGSLPAYVALVPPRDASGVFEALRLTAVTSRDGERESVSTPFDVNVRPVADGVELSPELSFGDEGDKIPLNLSGSMTDGSETTTLILTGLGEHAGFFTDGGDTLLDSLPDASVSYDDGSDTYTLEGITSAQLNDLYLVQGATDGPLEVQYEAWTLDGADRSASSSGSFDVEIKAVEPTSGDDTLLYTGEPLDGLGGVDVVELRFGENPDPANLDNIEVIDLMPEGQDHALTLSAQDVLDITGDAGDVLSLLGDGGDSVGLNGAWTNTGAENTGGVNYQVYASNDTGATLKVQEEVSVEI